jgi:hypothetical protein
MTDEEFQKLWLEGLSDKKKQERILRAFAVLKLVAEKQINSLKQYESSPQPKEIGFMYYLNTLISIWDNIAFITGLANGIGKYKQFGFYPARNILENGFRLEYFFNQTEDGRNKIAVTEFLRVIKRSYIHEKVKGRDATEYGEHYIYFSSTIGGFPDIDDFDEDSADPFPGMKRMTKDSKIEGGVEWYHQYQSLCEVTHGKLFRTMMASYSPSGEYVWSLVYAEFMAIYILKLTDLFIQGSITEETINAIKKAEKIVKKPVKK